MSQYDRQGEQNQPALGQPLQGQPEQDDEQSDFAEEHQQTAVDEEIITGEDTDREPESPQGWSGMQP
jgi:hypothetical protein